MTADVDVTSPDVAQVTSAASETHRDAEMATVKKAPKPGTRMWLFAEDKCGLYIYL